MSKRTDIKKHADNVLAAWNKVISSVVRNERLRIADELEGINDSAAGGGESQIVADYIEKLRMENIDD